MRYKCFFDGCCYPKNPFGAIGFGWAVMDGSVSLLEPHRDTIEYGSGYEPASMGNSANKAEYLAFIGLIEWIAANHQPNDEFLIFGDSKLVIEQMNGFWRIKNGLYAEVARVADDLFNDLKGKCKCTLKWIPREMNDYADSLSRLDMPEEIEIMYENPCTGKIY